MNQCTYCGLTYDKLRTGETYQSIYEQFWRGPDSATWVNKRRHTILGRWHEIKQGLWAEHLETCERQAEYIENLATQESADAFGHAFELAHVVELGGVPF